MNNIAAISAVNRALAHYRCHQEHAPTDHSAREIAQMSMLAEYLHESPTPDPFHSQTGRRLRADAHSRSRIGVGSRKAPASLLTSNPEAPS